MRRAVAAKFDGDGSECAAKRVAGGNARAHDQGRVDLGQQGHPTGAMIDDDDPVMAAEGTCKRNAAGGWRNQGRATPRCQGEAARANSV